MAGAGGSCMAERLLREPGIEVHGTVRRRGASALRNLAGIIDRVTLHECDLADLASLLPVLRAARPDAIFHFASSASVPASFITPAAVLANNILGTCNLLEAVRLAEIDPLILQASTAKVYGTSLDGRPLAENAPIRPDSPYAVSKAAQDGLADVYGSSYGLKIVRTRTFGYINPRREDLFSSAFARQVARIEAGRQRELLHGNLGAVRTLLDVRDAMEANWLAALRGEPGETYNIGGTTTMSVGEFLEVLKRRGRIPIPSRLDPALLRPVDTAVQIPDCTRFVKATDWRPEIDFEESVRDLLEEWRRRVSVEAA
jgi:GDPmannose 4,6-dehydratase/GDP-4-dehydro-6-deoxy-D-mannose reductase